jgi:tmRNA-binding protein
MHSKFTAHVRVNNYSHGSNGMEPQRLRILLNKKLRMYTLQNHYQLHGFIVVNICCYLTAGPFDVYESLRGRNFVYVTLLNNCIWYLAGQLYMVPC